MDHKIKEPWFNDGLRFKCTGCGKCCTGSSGYVFLSPSDLSAMAKHLQISEKEFIDRYTRLVDDQICLIDAPQTDACIFLQNKKCSIYQARPVQCRTFPWWLHTLKNPKSWQDAAKDCEGINHPDAPLINGQNIAVECMVYVDNLVEQNSGFDYNHSKNSEKPTKP